MESVSKRIQIRDALRKQLEKYDWVANATVDEDVKSAEVLVKEDVTAEILQIVPKTFMGLRVTVKESLSKDLREAMKDQRYCDECKCLQYRDGRHAHADHCLTGNGESAYDHPMRYDCGRCGEKDLDMWCSKGHDDAHVPVYHKRPVTSSPPEV